MSQFLHLKKVLTGVGEVPIWKASFVVVVVACSFREPVGDDRGDVATQTDKHVLSDIGGLTVVVVVAMAVCLNITHVGKTSGH